MDELCDCGHDYRQHRHGGRCAGLDSYGLRCTCPSPVPWTDTDEGDEGEG